MMGNIIPGKLRFVQRATRADFTVALGAAGYVDTDVSATTGTNANTLWVVRVETAGTPIAGARPHGSTDDTKSTVYGSSVFFVRCDASGHMDFYRNAAVDVKYQLVGYFI